MATYSLSEPTLISALMATWAGASDTAPTVALNGYDLIVDADAAAYNSTIANTGGTCHLELRDGGRIKLAATLPSTVCPWVDPEHPLPESNYTAGLTANASAEIQLSGAFGLGGGPAKLPTATRAGNFWGKATAFPSSNKIAFSRDLPLRPGDIIFPINPPMLFYTVASYDATTATCTIDRTIDGNNKVVGLLFGLLAGGVCINILYSISRSVPVFSAKVRAGTLAIISSAYTGSVGGPVFGDSIIADRVASRTHQTYSPNNPLIYNADGYIQQATCTSLMGGGCGRVLVREAVAVEPYVAGSTVVSGVILSGIHTGTMRELGGHDDLLMQNSHISGIPQIPESSGLHLVHCEAGASVIDDSVFESSGTVTRVARTDFPVDTDLPDAFYHAPATAADTPWRYEDYWVRKGETLRIACRAMRGGDDAKARVAIGEMAVWVPANGMPTLAEWRCEGGQALEWQGGSVEWTNLTGEDCQVRVWTMATGLSGAYLRTWKATGGAL